MYKLKIRRQFDSSQNTKKNRLEKPLLFVPGTSAINLYVFDYAS